MLDGTKRDLQTMRSDIKATGLPLVVRLHGAPVSAPALSMGKGYGPCGSLCFRSWGNTYVEVRPERPLTQDEWTVLAPVIEKHAADAGLSMCASADNIWPFVE